MNTSDESVSTKSTANESLKSSLSDAGEHLKTAASAASAAFRSIVNAASEEWKSGRGPIKAALADSAKSGKSAFVSGGSVAKDKLDTLRDKAGEAYAGAKELAKQRPLAAIGAAFAAGWVVARLVRAGRR